MGIGEAIEAVRQLGVVRAEAGRLLIEVDRRHLGALEAHVEVLRRGKAQALALLEAESTRPTQSQVDAASSHLNEAGAGVQRMGNTWCVLLPAGADVSAARRALVVLDMADAVLWLA